MSHCNDSTCSTENTAVLERPQAVQPRFNHTEDENGIVLRIALPGVARENLKLTLLESNLKVEATRTNTVPENWKPRREAKPPAGYALNLRLSRRFDGTRSEATLDAGILTLRVPLNEEAKPRQIAVN